MSYFRNKKYSTHEKSSFLPLISPKNHSFVESRSNQLFLTPSKPKNKFFNHESNSNSLSRYQSELQTTNEKLHRRMSRINTEGIRQIHEKKKYKKINREIREVKDLVNFKMEEQSLRLELKLRELNEFGRNPQVVYQPFPMMMPAMYPPMVPQNMPNQNQVTKPIRRQRNLGRLFRKAVHVTLFTIYLRRFTERVVKYRKRQFQHYLHETNDFREEANRIKVNILQACTPFFKSICIQEEQVLTLNLEEDSESAIKEKTLATRKHIHILLNCLDKYFRSSDFQGALKSIYYFCRHGSYACLENMMTLQEITNISISEKHDYLQAEKNLEKSQIINFLFFKILIYNGIGQPWKIDQERFSKGKIVLQENINLVASIVYELLMDIQDDYIVAAPDCYPVGNFQRLKGSTKLFPSESLTVKAGHYRKNEMISGLVNEKYIKRVYNTEKKWTVQRKQLLEMVEFIHSKLVRFHSDFIQPFL